jgi:hypothetical protein
MPETGASGEHALARMHEVKDHLYDRNMSLNCGNVELRGYEPLTSCMPCLTVPSGGVPLGRVTARQGNGLVRWGLATSAVVWGALSLTRNWFVTGNRPVFALSGPSWLSTPRE